VATGGSDVNLGIDISKKGEGDKEAAAGLELVAKAADNAADELKQLDRKLLETRAALLAAGKDFAKTGDASPFKQLLKDERQLQQVSKTLTRLTGDVEGFGKTGEKAAVAFGEGFTELLPQTLASGVKFLAANPEFAAIGAAVAVPLAAGLSAALSGAVLAGTAGVGLGAGIALAAKSSEVHDAWIEVANTGMHSLQDAASSFQEPLVRAAKVFGDELESDLPRIRRDFEIIAPLVDDLAKGAAGFFHNLQPGLQDAFRGALPVIKELSAELPKLGDDVSHFFSDLGGTGRTSAQALSLAIDATGASLRGLGTVLAETSTLFELTGTGALGLLHDLGVLGNTADILTASPLASLSQVLGGNKNSSDDFSKSLEKLKQDMDTAGAQKAFDEGMKTAAAALREGQAAARDMEHQVSDLANTLLGTKDADIAFKQGLLDLNQTLKDNKGTTDERTKAGLDDEAAILAQFHAAVQLRDATLQQKNDQEAANKVFDDAVAKIYATAQAHGIDKQKVDELSGSIRDIPRPDPVAIELKRLGYSDDDLREMKRGLLTMPSADPHIDLRRQGYSDEDIRELGRAVNNLPSYHRINVEVAYSTTGSAGTASGRIGNIRPVAHGDIIGAARGMVASSAPTVVFGERTLPEAYIPAPNSGITQGRADMLLGTAASWWGRKLVPSGGGGGGVQTVQLELSSDGGAASDLVLDLLRSAVKVRGSNVQIVVAGKPAQ
jgi:hypothetical protein